MSRASERGREGERERGRAGERERGIGNTFQLTTRNECLLTIFLSVGDAMNINQFAHAPRPPHLILSRD